MKITEVITRAPIDCTITYDACECCGINLSPGVDTCPNHNCPKFQQSLHPILGASGGGTTTAIYGGTGTSTFATSVGSGGGSYGGVAGGNTTPPTQWVQVSSGDRIQPIGNIGTYKVCMHGNAHYCGLCGGRVDDLPESKLIQRSAEYLMQIRDKYDPTEQALRDKYHSICSFHGDGKWEISYLLQLLDKERAEILVLQTLHQEAHKKLCAALAELGKLRVERDALCTENNRLKAHQDKALETARQIAEELWPGILDEEVEASPLVGDYWRQSRE